MTELLLNTDTTGKTTYLDDDEIIFKDIGGDDNYENDLDHHHMFDAGDGYKVVMEIKNTWSIEDTSVESYVHYGTTIYDRLGFRTKETSVSDWVNGKVPWFIKTVQTDKNTNVWGNKLDSMGDGWILPPNLTILGGLTTYNYVSGTADVNGFIPINYEGGAQIVSWHFFSDKNVVEPGWEIKITRVAMSNKKRNAGSDNAVICTGNGVYNITNTGSITCS
jgi:hypothetical protein